MTSARDSPIPTPGLKVLAEGISEKDSHSCKGTELAVAEYPFPRKKARQLGGNGPGNGTVLILVTCVQTCRDLYEITPFCTIASPVHFRRPDRSLLVRLTYLRHSIPSSCQGFTDQV
mgnify:CR=1 FL=1